MRHYRQLRQLFLFPFVLSILACNPGVPDESQVKPDQVLSANDSSSLPIEKASFGLPLGSLPPKVQQSLQRIRVLRLTDGIIDSVWNLSQPKNSYEVIVLDCSSGSLSTSRVKAIVDWAKQGHGLLIQARHVDRFSHELLPAPCYLESKFYLYNKPHPELVPGSELVRDVSLIENYFWCAGGNSVLHLLLPLPDGEREYSESERQDPLEVLTKNGGELFPVLYSTKDLEGHYLVTSRYQHARVAWFSGDINFANKGCQPQYDDVRLWSNLMHWLADEGRRGGEAL